MRLNNKGFTLIEIIITLSIASVLFILLIGVFSTSLRFYEDLNNSNEIKQQAQSITDFITTRVMSSTEINDVFNYNNTSYYKSDKEIVLGELRLKDNSLNEKELHIFSIQKDPKVEGQSIRYGKVNVAKIEAGNYINSINVRPLPIGHTYENARGLKITLKMKKGRTNLEILKSIYFRN